MAELLSVRFSKIGYRDARLDGLSYSLATTDGTPENALIIGSNSSGKTSQLHLIFSIFLPHHNELVSQKDRSGRQFAYYFEEGEIGFVATEWSIPGNRTLPGMAVSKTRVIGRFTQFTNRDKYENTTVFFSFVADDELGIDDLPITSSIPHRVTESRKTISDTKKYLRDVFDDKPSREFYLTENMSDWQTHLRNRGFNIEQFKLMMQFTMSEGDSSSFLKQFKDNEMVLKFLCHDVLDKSTTDRLHGMLSQHRESVRLEPVTRAQIAAYSALFDRFVMMKPTTDDYVLAANNRQRIMEALRMVASRVAATLKAAETHLDRLKNYQTTDEMELKCQRIELADFEARLRGVNKQIAILTCEEATQSHQACIARLNQAKQLHRGMQALVGRVKVENAHSQAEDLARQLNALSEPLRSLTDDVAMARAVLYGFLSIDAEQAEKKYKIQLDAVTDASNEKKKLDDLMNECSGIQGRKLQEKATIDKLEINRLGSIEQLVAGKLLSGISSCPHTALTAFSDSLADAEARRSSLENEKLTIVALLAGIQVQLKSNKADLDRLHNTLSAAEETLLKYSDERSVMIWLPGICTMFEQTEPDLFLPALTDRLQERYEKETFEITRIEAEIAKLTEQIAAIEGHGGLLPPARDVKRVIETLESVGITAYTWWQIFSERNVPVDEAKRLVEAYPARYGGVAVALKRDLDKARELLVDGCGVLAPVIISIYTDGDNGAAYEGLAIFPDVALAIDHKRSAEFCEKTRSDIEKYGAALPVIKQSRDDLLHAKEKLVGFLAKYDDSFHSALEKTIALKRSELDSCRLDRSRLDEQTRQAESGLTAIEFQLVEVADVLKSLKGYQVTLKTHIDTHETGRDDRIRRVSELVEELSAIESNIARCEDEIRAAGEHESSARELAGKGEALCSSIRGELDKLTGEKKPPTVDFQSLATSTESARTLFTAKDRALDAASVDAEYIRIKALAENAEKEFSKSTSEWREKFGKLSEEDIHEASNYIEGRMAIEGDVEDLLATKAAAQVAESHAERSKKEAANKLDELITANTSLKVVPFTDDATTCREQETKFSSDIDHAIRLISNLTEAINSRTVEIANCAGRVNLLSNLASQEDVTYVPEAEPFATDTEAEIELKAVRKAKTDAEEKVKQVYDKLKRFSNDLAKFLDDPLCAQTPQVVSSIKEELHRCEGVLTEGIDALIEHVQHAMAPLSHELDTLEQKKGIVVTEVMHDVKKALLLLSNLEKKSRVPPLGGIWRDWTNRAFIRFKTSVNPETEQARISVAGTVTRLAQAEGKLPSGAIIVQTALSELLGNAYTIETLKPDTSPSTNYVGVGHPEGLHSWSGGQKLSGSVLFYMAMCNLLSFEGQPGGILLMDNPFGSCNHIEFVRLIVALTRQYGVQMIAYTSTEDFEIRRLYPVNILIRKGGAAGIVKRTGHTLVQQDKTIYNDGETTSLEINPEAPHAS
jgi:hypothetical protein